MTAAEITTVEPDPTKPQLAVQLQAQPPIVGKGYRDQPVRGHWTLDLLERTLFEFRSCGAWDEAKVELGGYPETVKCEVLARVGEEAMPWGWRPSQGPPPPPDRPPLLPDPVVPDSGWSAAGLAGVLGSRVLHGVLLLVLVAFAIAGRI